MPVAPRARCAEPGCGAMAETRGRCADHQRKAWANPSRNTATLTRYQREQWHVLVFTTHGDRCAYCGEPATEADHIVPVSRGGALQDVGNGQPLCTPCHQAKSLAER